MIWPLPLCLNTSPIRLPFRTILWSLCPSWNTGSSRATGTVPYQGLCPCHFMFLSHSSSDWFLNSYLNSGVTSLERSPLTSYLNRVASPALAMLPCLVLWPALKSVCLFTCFWQPYPTECELGNGWDLAWSAWHQWLAQSWHTVDPDSICGMDAWTEQCTCDKTLVLGSTFHCCRKYTTK